MPRALLTKGPPKAYTPNPFTLTLSKGLTQAAARIEPVRTKSRPP